MHDKDNHKSESDKTVIMVNVYASSKELFE